MESDIVPTSPLMPRSSPFEPARDQPSHGVSSPASSAGVAVEAVDRSDRSSVFAHLVKDDGDIAGLVAYSIYKQNKLDWLRAFEVIKARAPDENELAAYIIGEGTPRRLATYRHLAEATLAGNGPEVDGAPGSATRAPAATRRLGRSAGEGLAGGMIALYGLIAALFVLGFYLAMHYTAVTR